ncbi:MAG: arginyltransferase [Planctomycetes bacterium]|nr:arginyltransferase [Planctomycetota bacterium]
MNQSVEELLVYDECAPCPYLPERSARMPLRYPLQQLTSAQMDSCLAAGDRRSGEFLYRTECPGCRACEAIRLEVSRFVPRRTQRRVLRRGDRVFSMDVGPPVVNLERVALYNAHREARKLDCRDGPIDVDSYRSFLVDSCCETFEMRYRIGDRLVAVGICDRGKNSMSAVYCFFDPRYSRLSPGVYSVLKQIELCQRDNVRYLYLGYYIADSPHMRYKANYLPHERMINGQWQEFSEHLPATVG